MQESQYEEVIETNPLLSKHPDFIRDSGDNSRDFMFADSEM